MIEVTDFSGQNWLITPAACAVNEAAPKSIAQQKWLLVLSGVGVTNLEAKTDDWLQDTVHILPDVTAPLNNAISQYSIPRPSGSFQLGFQLEQWSPFAGLSSIFDQDNSVNTGFSVNDWRPSPFSSGADAFSGQPVDNIFTGIIVDVAVRDQDAWLYRVSYNITLTGWIAFTQAPFSR
jgi:hypothetical protein